MFNHTFPPMFSNAETARYQSLNDIVIFNEVVAIQQAILTAIQAGQFSVQVNSTTMTFGTQAVTYYQCWQNDAGMPQLLQIRTVFKYFEDLNYKVKIQNNSSTGTTFYWLISW